MKYLEIPAVCGLLTINHVATGSFYMVESVNIHDAAIMANGQLKLGKYQNPKLQALYNESPELDYTYVECVDKAESKATRQAIMAVNYGNDKLLNQQDWPKLVGTYELQHTSGMVYVGATDDIIKQNSYQYTLLRGNKHKSPHMQKLYNEDPDSVSFVFSVCRDKEQARLVADKRMQQLKERGLLLNKKSVSRVPQGIHVYRLVFPDGSYYVGSTRDLPARMTHHKSEMNNGRHPNSRVLEKWKEFGTFTHEVYPFDNIEDARLIEKATIQDNRADPKCLNIVDTGIPANLRYLNMDNEEQRNAYIKHQRTVINRDRMIREVGTAAAKGKWKDPESLAKRSGAGNPFAKRLMVDGLEYGAFVLAMKELGVSRTTLKKRLDDPEDTAVYYI